MLTRDLGANIMVITIGIEDGRHPLSKMFEADNTLANQCSGCGGFGMAKRPLVLPINEGKPLASGRPFHDWFVGVRRRHFLPLRVR